MDFYLKKDIEEIVKNIEDIAPLFEGKTILLTGGRGFLGRYFTEVFVLLNKNVLKKPCKVISADNFITAGKIGMDVSHEDENIKFIKADVIEPLEINESIDFIMHAAGIASPFYYRAHPLKTLDVGITGTRNMLELAKKHQAKILFFSSSEIYGDPDPRFVPIQESYRGNVSCLGPRACYDESKRVGETLCRIYHTQFGTHTNMVRPFNVYGPGMQETDFRVLPNFASRIKEKKALKVYGSGNQTRTFCYITDAIQGFLRVLVKGTPGEPYNIGNPTPEISIHELVGYVEKVMDQKLKVDIIDYPDSYPADEPLRRCPDIKKAQVQLDYEPKVSLIEGLTRFLYWTDATYGKTTPELTL